MRYSILFTLILILLCCGVLQAQGTQLLRQPTLSEDEIVFIYANDLWIVDRKGGDAKRLTSNEGAEFAPHFSQDGSMIAFSAQYGGNTDVYIVNAEGGSPQRLTWHSGLDRVEGWTPDGKILFGSGRMAHPTETFSFYKVGTDGGLPEALNVTRAAYGEMSENGEYLAYTPINSWDPEWRNYRGGQAMPIWIQDANTGAVIKTPQLDAERHLYPVWIGEVVYYLSERDYVSNIWSYDINTQQEKQITFHKRFDVKSLDADNDDIIYEQGGYLHLFSGATGGTQQLTINVKGDMNFARERWETVSASSLGNPNISPNGKRAIFEHRGEIITVPKKNGSSRNLTASSGTADRSPIWSPKGDEIAWFDDAEGEYQLIIANQYGVISKRMAVPSQTFYFRPDWSADGSKIVFTDTHYNMWFVDLETEEFTKVDTDGYAHPNRTMNPIWSPDSRYLTYVKQQKSHFKAVFIYDTGTKSTHQVTDGIADVVTPIFDQSGEYLYYLGSTDYGLASGWLDMSSYDPEVSRTLYVSVLHQDGKSPFLPKSDDEEIKEEEEGEESDKKEDVDDSKKGDKEESDKKEEEKPKPIDFEGIKNRVVAVSDVSGEYIALERAPKGKVTVVGSGEGGSKVQTYDFEKKKLDEWANGVSSIVTSYDGAYALYQGGGNWNISSLSAKPNEAEDGLKVDLKIKLNPQEEYHQIFKEGWRYMRDFLYVDNVHGAPWDKVWEWYAPWINHVRHRTDLNYVVDIMSGEVAIGHSYVRGGDMPDIDRVQGGLLGADYKMNNGLYQIEKIYTGELWNPNVTAPLYAPGLGVNEGNYIISINGNKLTASDNINAFLEETAGKQVRLEIKSDLNDETQIAIVEPIANDGSLRTIEWMESNRRKVDELSDGKLAYVWVPNTAGAGFTNFNRYYFSQQDKKGVIIDERNNGGGSAADYMIDIMSREVVGYFNSKAGDRRPWTTPIAGIWGPKVMIINERAGSGGDLLPYMFKEKGLGSLIGTRTWGGLVGTWDTPPFIDGGRMVAPRGGFYDVDGKWAVEGEGVSPDIEVNMDPVKVLQGQDPQLEAAVDEALRLLQLNPFELQQEPAAPIRSKRPDGWDKE
ncbi:MAG: tricorn protease [Saprospiraceae bacterium]|jgi:tricorn protease